MGRAAKYHRLSAAEKQLAYLDRMREPGVRCPRCETETTPSDLMRHSCSGPREPHARSRWVSWREATAIVPKGTIVRWIRRGMVRTRGALQERQYLLRDLAARVAERRARRR